MSTQLEDMMDERDKLKKLLEFLLEKHRVGAVEIEQLKRKIEELEKRIVNR